MNRWSLLTKGALIQRKRLLKRDKSICHELRKVCLYKITEWSRHFSHVTKSRIFKNRNSRKKVNHNFRGTFLKNLFRHLKLYSNTPSWLATCRCHMGTFWKTKDWSSYFWEGQPFRFGTSKFSAKEDLNWQKQVFLHNFRPWPTQKPKIWSIFYGK